MRSKLPDVTARMLLELYLVALGASQTAQAALSHARDAQARYEQAMKMAKAGAGMDTYQKVTVDFASGELVIQDEGT